MPNQATPTHLLKPNVFIETDVLYAGSAAPSTHGASLVVLCMAEITLVKAYTSQQVIDEVERNLKYKLPGALPAMRLIMARCMNIVLNPKPAELEPYQHLANPADLPILVVAIQSGCPWLVSFNLKHYQPGHPSVTVLTPGDFLLHIRSLLAKMT